MTFKEKFDIFLGVVGEILWRGFGIFLFILGGAAGSGAVITGDPTTGILIAWVTLMLGVVGAVGYAIATTGRATKKTVSDAANDAVKKVEENTKK
jgi:TRAP-type C4-dicarboxylate transport system permease small subunit